MRAASAAASIIFARVTFVFGLKREPSATISLVEYAIDLDLDAFARRTAMAGAGGQKSARLFDGLGLNTPFFEPCNQHTGMEKSWFCVADGVRRRPVLAHGTRLGTSFWTRLGTRLGSSSRRAQ